MFKNDKWRLAASIAPPMVLVAMAVTVACTSDTTSGPRGPLSLSATVAWAKLDKPQRERIEAAKARSRWVGDAHHAGMKVVIKAIAERKTSKRPMPKAGSAEHCAILRDVGVATLDALDAARGVISSNADRVGRVNRDPALASCSATMSVFGLVASWPSAAQSLTEDYDPEVSGAYEWFLDPMYAAVQASDGSVASVTEGVNNVLAEAISTGIPEGDLLALTAFAGLIESSAVEWNAFNWSAYTGGNTCTTTDCTKLMSVFAPSPGGAIFTVIGADAIGCLSTVKGWGALRVLVMAPAWQALAGACGLRGSFASAGAVLALLK